MNPTTAKRRFTVDECDRIGAAGVVIEVAESSLTSDRGAKADLYARAGIPELWVGDLDAETVEILTRPDATAGFERRETRRRGESLAPEALPGLSIAVEAPFG